MRPDPDTDLSWIDSYLGYLLLLVRANGMLLGLVPAPPRGIARCWAAPQRLRDGTGFNSVVRATLMTKALRAMPAPPPAAGRGATPIPARRDHIRLVVLTFSLIEHRPTHSVLAQASAVPDAWHRSTPVARTAVAPP